MTYEVTVIEKFPNHWSDAFIKAGQTQFMKCRYGYSADKAKCTKLERLPDKTQRFTYELTYLQ